jgi:hypothetical protein
MLSEGTHHTAVQNATATETRAEVSRAAYIQGPSRLFFSPFPLAHALWLNSHLAVSQPLHQ